MTIIELYLIRRVLLDEETTSMIDIHEALQIIERDIRLKLMDPRLDKSKDKKLDEV